MQRPQQHDCCLGSATCGAEEQAGVRTAPGVQPDRVADDIAQALRALLGHPRGHSHRRDAPRLRDQDVAGAALALLDGLSEALQTWASHVLYPQVRSSRRSR